MSKIPVIGLNDGTSWSSTTDKLRTGLVGSGSADWLPEDESERVALDVTENNTYSASSDGVYGYGLVTVSVNGESVTGIGADGKTYTVTRDSNGNLVWTEVTEG